MSQEELIGEIQEAIHVAVSSGIGIVVEGGEDIVSRSLYRKRDIIVSNLSVVFKWAITRIAQAIIETGELDEWLGIVGRGRLVRTVRSHLHIKTTVEWESGEPKNVAVYPFIALRGDSNERVP